MTREEKILYHINKKGYGIEIGPSFNPIASKKNGYKVSVIDHLPKNQLIEKYKALNMSDENITKIEDVDYVWDGRPYAELTRKPKFYDWINASHVIEHTPDLIAFLIDCDGILKNDGVLSLVVPDSRYCFDCFRPITGLSKIIDAHLCKTKIHTPGTAAEYLLNQVSKGERITWYSQFAGEYSCRISLQEAQNVMNNIRNNKEYIDLHAWVFTPSSFRLLINDLYNLQFVPFKEVLFFPTEGCEFYVTLSRKGGNNHFDRLQMLKAMRAEIVAGSTDPILIVPPSNKSQHDFYGLAISGIKTISNEGWISFFKKSFRWSFGKIFSRFHFEPK